VALPMITGIVTDSSGRPAAEAVVSVTAAPVPVPDIAALTDVAGRFSITVPVTGDYRLLARGDAFSREVDVVVEREVTEVEVELAD
jgi:hypothetical protein